MKVALVYDRINKFGGAERVLKVLHEIYPDAPIYTLVHSPEDSVWAKNISVHASPINRLRFLSKHHEVLVPIAPMMFETFNFDQYDMVISLTSSDAKSIITKPHTFHLCYCLTPNRYLWHLPQIYANDWKIKITPTKLLNYFRKLDLLLSKRPDRYIAISEEVKNRITTYYHQNSVVVHPSIEDKFYAKNLSSYRKRKYYLWVGRLVPYKKADLVVSVFSKLKFPLLVAGSGSEYSKLKRMASPNVKFLGPVSDARLIRLYKNAKGLVFPQEEDYGLVPIEAQACGTPVIAFNKGGARETVKNHLSGIFFNEQTEASLTEAVLQLEKMDFRPKDIQAWAKNFSKKEFKKQFASTVSKLYSSYFTNSAS